MINQRRPMGAETLPEFYFRFAMWAEKHDQFLTRETVCNHFDVSPATASRWLRAWKNAKMARIIGEL